MEWLDRQEAAPRSADIRRTIDFSSVRKVTQMHLLRSSNRENIAFQKNEFCKT